MRRRPSNFLSAREARAMAARKARAAAPSVFVSHNAICNIIERECDKAGRDWYGHMTKVANEIEALVPESRKEARQMVLARLDRFPQAGETPGKPERNTT